MTSNIQVNLKLKCQVHLLRLTQISSQAALSPTDRRIEAYYMDTNTHVLYQTQLDSAWSSIQLLPIFENIFIMIRTCD